MKIVSLPPYAPTLIESTRAIGYTLESAVADIIDNSITAMASCIDLFFFPENDSYIAILDNGNGMDSTDLENAMRYGSQNPNDNRDENDLGRFGLGLKTASLSQCRTLTVVSKQKGKVEARRWDIDYVTKTENWSLLVLETEEELSTIPRINELNQLKSGTLVVWQNLDRLKVGEVNFDRSMSKKMSNVRDHLSLVFHRYINGEAELKKLCINMNALPIEPADPFLTKRNTQVMADEVLYVNDAKVIVRPFILPHTSALSSDEIYSLGGKEGLRKSQGFYIYRNKRLLLGGTWFRMVRQGELSKLARIQVDIPNELDSLWTLDIKKSSAILPEVMRSSLESIVERLAEKSKQTWTFRGKKETNDSVVHVWQRFKGKHGGFYYNINRDHPMVTMFTDASPNVRRNLETLLKAIESHIPLNQLYIDLNSDKQIENDVETTAYDIEATLKFLLDQMPTNIMRMELLERLSMSAPFVDYPYIIIKFRT